jgi:hypothetical protein
MEGVPLRGLFKGQRGAEESSFFVEVTGEEQAGGQAAVHESARDRHLRMTG